MIKLLIAIILSLGIAHAQIKTNVPQFPQDKYLLRTHLRYFFKKGKSLYQAEAVHNSKIDNRVNREYQIGYKYRFHNNMKAGFGFARRYGLRHDDDWKFVPGQWSWEATNGRGENHFILDVSPRFDFDKFVAEFRVRNEYNFFNDQDTLRLRPGLTYFWFRNGNPFINIFAQYEAHIPINYNVDNHGIREGWFWLGGLYHLHRNFKVGGYFAYRDMFWGTSQMFNDVISNGASYVANEQSWEIGLIFNIHNFD